MTTRSSIVLQAALVLIKPVVRLLLRHGVGYPSFATALKQVFLEAAQEQLQQQGRAQTDSALSLLSGVHRRDVRNLTRADSEPQHNATAPMSMATQVVARWLSHPDYLDATGNTLALPRSQGAHSFDALVANISSDVRPRAVLDELVSLGIADDTGQGIVLREPGFVPRQGFAAMASLLGDNLHDHAAAAASNIDQGSNYLEQSVFVDGITEQSAQHLHAVSAKAWRQAFKTVMQAAAVRFEDDKINAKPAQRKHRARFGSYFYTQAQQAAKPTMPPAKKSKTSAKPPGHTP